MVQHRHPLHLCLQDLPLGARNLLKQHHARRKPVNEILPAHRAEFALSEESGERNAAYFGVKGLGVVMRFFKQAGTPAVAGEHQRAGRRPFVGPHVHL